jgi:hypothetical protein
VALRYVLVVALYLLWAVTCPENACPALGLVYDRVVNDCLLCLYIETVVGRGLLRSSAAEKAAN